jgi:hypothetical protein
MTIVETMKQISKDKLIVTAEFIIDKETFSYADKFKSVIRWELDQILEEEKVNLRITQDTSLKIWIPFVEKRLQEYVSEMIRSWINLAERLIQDTNADRSSSELSQATDTSSFNSFKRRLSRCNNDTEEDIVLQWKPATSEEKQLEELSYEESMAMFEQIVLTVDDMLNIICNEVVTSTKEEPLMESSTPSNRKPTRTKSYVLDNDSVKTTDEMEAFTVPNSPGNVENVATVSSTPDQGYVLDDAAVNSLLANNSSIVLNGDTIELRPRGDQSVQESKTGCCQCVIL